MKIRHLLLIVVAFSTISCSLLKGSSSASTTQSTDGAATSSSLLSAFKLPENVDFNGAFKNFWQDLLADIMKTSTIQNLTKYIPSKELISQYSIANIENQYIVSGFATVDTQVFSESEATAAGATLTKQSDNIYSFIVPITKLQSFVNVKGLERVELARNVNKTAE